MKDLGPLKEGVERSSEVSQEGHGRGSSLGLHHYPCFQLYLFEAETPVREHGLQLCHLVTGRAKQRLPVHMSCAQWLSERKQNWPLEHYKASETSLSFLWGLHCKPGTWRQAACKLCTETPASRNLNWSVKAGLSASSWGAETHCLDRAFLNL